MFQLLHCHGYIRFTSPPRIKGLITPVSYCPSFNPFLCLFLISCLSFVCLCFTFFVRHSIPQCLCLCRFLLTCLFCFQEFFRNLSHWMDQHVTMNDSGNFLIETCDDNVSLELKQQLLLLNGRWRDLFMKVKQVNK